MLLRKIPGLCAIAALTFCSAWSAASAHEYKVGSLVIEHPWSRATPKGAPVAGGYLVIRNEGAAADRLIAVESEAAKSVQIHEMTMQDGVMRMRPLANGLEAPAGGKAELTPGGNHLMFLDPVQPFEARARIKAVLVFEKAGKVPVEFMVEPMGGAPKPEAEHGGGHEGMQH